MRITVALIVGLAVAVAGCAPKKAENAEEYFSVASDHLRHGSYEQAVEQYRSLLDEHPFSEHSEEAELKIGIAQYKAGTCPEATAAFTDFQRRHPTSPHLPLVGYLLGQCAEQQMRPSDRDQSASQNAHAYYQALIQQHPDSPYAELARNRLQSTRETLAQHELEIAGYYKRHDNLKAAETRLLDLVNRFNDTDVAGTALLQLGEIYRSTDQQERAVLAFSSVTYHHPDHEAARAAEQALTELVGDDGERPSGDPLAVLRALAGRTREIAIAQTPKQIQRKGSGAPTSPGAGAGGLGLPGSSGPFSRGSGSPGAYGSRY
ncbi:MAG: outer membrane protein assembly factor BamD [Candidatus Binatia bacterium]